MNTERYAANIALCEIDLPGQQRLRSANVMVCGCGALASPALLYLAASGVGHITIADPDRVELSNLQRQIIHDTHRLGQLKVESAADTIRSLNPDVTVTPVAQRVTADNATTLFKGHDVILDCTDNYTARRDISHAAAAMSLPLCFAAVSRFQSQAFTQMPGTATYADIFPIPPTQEQTDCTSCANAGVLNAAAGMAGAIQAAEAIKIITGTGDLLTDRLLLIDTLTFKFTTISITKA